jgi:hypothetical protein
MTQGDSSCHADGMTEEELAEELSELEQALSALEGEALYGGSPAGGALGGVPSPGAGASTLDRELAERLGLSDDSSDPSGESWGWGRGHRWGRRRVRGGCLGASQAAGAVWQLVGSIG